MPQIEWYVAQRYLKGTHRGRVRICMAGVSIGVAVLVVVISVMNGFERDFLGKMLGAYGHLRMFPVGTSQQGRRGLSDYHKWIEQMESVEGVRGVAPAIEQGIMMVSGARRSSEPIAQFVNVRGISPVYEEQSSDLIKSLLLGNWRELAESDHISNETDSELLDPFEVEAEPPAIFLGLELAKYLFRAPTQWHWSEKDDRLQRFMKREVLGQRVNLFVPSLVRGPSGEEPQVFEARVAGIFKTGFYDFDLRSALTSLETGQLLRRLKPGEVEFLEIQLDNPARADRVGYQLANLAMDVDGTQFASVPWMALNPVLLEAVKIEKVVMASILTMVVLVAVFGIASTLVMTVLEKTREIGTLLALGTRRKSIMWIFILNGFLVGLYGTVFGLLTGLGVCKLIDILDIRLPGGGGVYVLDLLPVEVRWSDIILIAAFALIASTFAGVYPAWKASRLNPVDALRYE